MPVAIEYICTPSLRILACSCLQFDFSVNGTGFNLQSLQTTACPGLARLVAIPRPRSSVTIPRALHDGRNHETSYHGSASTSTTASSQTTVKHPVLPRSIQTLPGLLRVAWGISIGYLSGLILLSDSVTLSETCKQVTLMTAKGIPRKNIADT